MFCQDAALHAAQDLESKLQGQEQSYTSQLAAHSLRIRKLERERVSLREEAVRLPYLSCVFWSQTFVLGCSSTAN